MADRTEQPARPNAGRGLSRQSKAALVGSGTMAAVATPVVVAVFAVGGTIPLGELAMLYSLILLFGALLYAREKWYR